MKDTTYCSRRDVFKGAALLAGAVVLGGSSARGADGVSASRSELRKLGSTDLMISSISLGTGPGQDVNVMKSAIAQGVNFIHTSTGYKGGKSIQNVAEAIRGQRDKVILGLKITWAPDDDEKMDAALETLGVDHVDIAFFNIHKSDQVRDPKYRKGAERWKKAGKFRYIGLTTHKQTAACLEAALDEGFYDALMPSYNFSMEEEFRPIFERAEKEGVGVVLMKTNKGLSGSLYTEAIPHYLNIPAVATINRGMGSFQQIRTFLESAEKEADAGALKQIRESVSVAMTGHCTMCGICEKSCPQGFEVADVVRCSDYYLENSEYVELARETYQGLVHRPDAAVCSTCRICESACKNAVPIVHHIRRAETVLA